MWQQYLTDEWRTDFPPPPGFDGEEDGEWEDDGYSRSLTAGEHAALAGAGFAEPPPQDVTLEADETERDAFFASLRACDIDDGAPRSGDQAILGGLDGVHSLAGEEP